MRETEVPSYFFSGLASSLGSQLGAMGGALSQLMPITTKKFMGIPSGNQTQQAQPMQCADGSAPRPGGINQMQSPEALEQGQEAMNQANPLVHGMFPGAVSNPAEEPDAPPQSAEEAAIIDQTAEQIKDDIATGSMGGGFQKAFQNILGIPGGGMGGFFGGGNTNPMDPLMRIRQQSNPIFGGMGMGGGGFFRAPFRSGGGLPDLLGMGARTTSRMRPRIGGLLGRGLGGLFGRMF